MDPNTAKAIILSVLFGSVGLAVIAAIWASAIRDIRRGKQERSQGLSVDEWAFRLHHLARALMRSQAGDDRIAGAVLLEHSHLLRPGMKCDCPDVEVSEPWRVGGTEVQD